MHTHTHSPQFGQRSSPHLMCYIYNRQVRAGLCIHRQTCTLINASTYAHKTNTHVRCMHAYLNTNRGVHEYTWTHIHVFTCMYARMYTSACTLMHAKCQHAHMHLRMRTHAHTHCTTWFLYAQSTRMFVSGSLHKHTEYMQTTGSNYKDFHHTKLDRVQKCSIHSLYTNNN